MDLYRTKYYEANFTHFAELLERNEGITLSVSTLTNILEAKHIFSPRVTKSKKKRVKKELERRKEAAKTKKDADEVQANIVAVDDATGAITGARFDSQETLKGYYGVYAARHI